MTQPGKARRRFDIRRKTGNNGAITDAEATPMRYEHLVEINDPLFPLLPHLTREQIWAGLMLRAHAPQRFIHGLDGAVVEEVPSDDATTVLRRTLDFGAFTVRDLVRMRPQESMHTEIEAGAEWPQSRLIISIEEPEGGGLYLRFVYEWDQASAGSELDHVMLALRKQAYHDSDLDTVVRLRELAANCDGP